MPPANSATVLLTCALLCILLLNTEIYARGKRCYVCRSRGSLGDCRDPFWYNSTSFSATDAVEVLPCASGWCGKSTEGKEGDHLQATERICLQRPPSDNEERCSETFYEKKRSPVFMCFCKGDLCNMALSSLHNINIYSVFSSLYLAYLINLRQNL